MALPISNIPILTGAAPLKLRFLQILFQKECAKIRECVYMVLESDIAVDEFDAVGDVRVGVAFN